MADPTTVRATWWLITNNNPTDDDRLRLKNPPSWVKRLVYQDEVGEKDQTLHIQLTAQTAQVRMSQVKQWLPRAHIEASRDKNACLNYVKKDKTAVEGTRVDEVFSDYMTMDVALLQIAQRAKDKEDLYMPDNLTAPERKRRMEEWIKEEYWEAVNAIVLEKPRTIGLFTNPQLERAWVKTRETWICILDRQDRQTETEA